MRYVLLAAVAAVLGAGSPQMLTDTAVHAESQAGLPGHSGAPTLAQGIPGSVYKSSQPHQGSNSGNDLA